MGPELADRIYECSFVPEFWPGVLDELGTIAESAAGTLFITKAEVQYWIASPAARERVARLVEERWLWRGQIVARAFSLRHPGFLTDLDVLTQDELNSEPIYRDFWRPQGLGWAVGTAIPIPTGENAILIISRPIDRGPVGPALVQRLDALRPHLARSILIAARLQLERARMASETLAALGAPALVLDHQGKVLAANHLIEALTGYVQWRALNRVSLKDRTADKLLRDAIAADLASGIVRSFPVRGADALATMIAHVVPIRLSARDIFVRCAAALVLTPITTPHAPPVELVQSLFDLTPSEARVARELAAGKTAQGIALEGGVSLNTVRTHVRGVLEKTGCNRQVDVVALLTAISSARPLSAI
jgi:DNA-binding CsgD family transcriptional regulator